MSALQKIQSTGGVVSSLQKALLATLFLRLSTSVLLAVLSVFLPVTECSAFACSEVVYSELMQESHFSRLFLAPWYRWDTTHYLALAENGYQLSQVEKTTWPPLFPGLIRGLSSIFPPLAGALIVSTLSAFAAFFLLHRYVSKTWDEAVADTALICYSVFPTSFFLVAGYTESTFIALALASLVSARSKNWLTAGLAGCLATLTRFQGIFLVLPLLWEGYSAFRQDRAAFQRRVSVFGLALAAIPLAFLLNAVYIHEIVQAPWPWLTKSSNWNTHLSFPGLGIVYNIIGLFHGTDFHGGISRFTDLVLLLLVLFLLIRRTPGMPVSFRIYAGIMLIPALTMINEWGVMTGVSRFILPIFPAIISFAWLLNKKTVKLLWIFVSFLFQCFLLMIFYNWGWIA